MPPPSPRVLCVSQPVPLVTEHWMGHPRVAWSHEKQDLGGGKSWKEKVQRAFLPEGWPESVTDDYLNFQLWDTAQAICSYVRGMMTSQAIMRGIGVGKEAATPLGAVFQVFVRDITGMIGGILFAYSEGSSFDSCAKQWRLFADLANNTGMLIEMISPFVPSLFLLLVCLGSLARALTGVAAGATRAALTQHFALRGNAADIAAKETSQETAVTAVGMVLGMLFTKLSSGHRGAEWALFAVLTVFHVWANVRAMRALVLRSLNQPRLGLLVQAYVDKKALPSASALNAQEDLSPPPLTRSINTLRKVFARAGLGKGGTTQQTEALPVVFGAPLGRDSYGEGVNIDGVRRLIKESSSQRYMVLMTPTCVKVVLHVNADSADLLRAYVHAYHLSIMCATAKGGSSSTMNKKLDASSKAWMLESYGPFRQALLDGGWHVDRVLIPKVGWTAEWTVTVDHHKD